MFVKQWYPGKGQFWYLTFALTHDLDLATGTCSVSTFMKYEHNTFKSYKQILNLMLIKGQITLESFLTNKVSNFEKSKDWRSWKSHWWWDLDILGLIDGHHPFTWQSCFYVIETALENRAERKTQGFLPIRLKFNGSSHIWLVFNNLTSLQFSWANAVTCNRQLPTKSDLFIFFFNISMLIHSLT